MDDKFCCFEDMSHFDTFLERLNSIRPTIQFTFEFSRTEMKVEDQPDLPTGIVESLLFLELEIMCKSNDDPVFRIYRTPGHAGNYLYAFSYQTLSQKTYKGPPKTINAESIAVLAMLHRNGASNTVTLLE